MAPYRKPIVLVTRPEDSARAFVEGLRSVAGDFDAVIAPAFGFEDVLHKMPSFQQAIFTSKAGVVTAPDGGGRIAWCVGDVTAEAASAKGYDARSAKGDADALVKVILEQGQGASLAHIRGETSHGNVRERLTAAGLNCVEVVTYRKTPQPAPDMLKTITTGDQKLILPVFSAETVSILDGWGMAFSQVHVVAISPNVAASAQALGACEITTSETPDLASMTQAVSGLIA